jgi:hypothetical protein
MYRNKRFLDIVTNSQNEVRDTSSSFTSICKEYANNRYFDIINRLITLNLFELERTKTISTVSGQRTYEMPFDFGEIVYALDNTSNRQLDVINEQELIQRYGISLTSTGSPVCVVLNGEGTVLSQPSSATKLKFVSSSNSDTTQIGFIRGISGSAEYYETVNLSGTTSGQSANNYDYFLQISKDSATTGAITFTYVTGGGNASVISPESLTQINRTIGFHYIPSGVFSIDIRYKRQIKPMVSNQDSPIIDIADGIEIGTKADAWRNKRQIATAADFENRYEMWLDRYINQRLANDVHQFDIQPQNRSEGY